MEERERWKGREFNEDSKDASHERIRSRDLRRINDRLRGLSQEHGRGGAVKKEKKRVTEATSCAKTDRMNPWPALEPRERYTPSLLSLFRDPRWRKIKREKDVYIYIYISLSAVNNCSSRPSRFVEVEISRVDPWETTMEIPWICRPSKIKGLFRRVKVRGSEEILL